MENNRFNIYSGLLKAFDDGGKKRFRTTASSTITDLAGDEILTPAIEKMAEKARGNLTIFLNHEYRVPEDVLGSVETASMTTRGVDGDGNPIVDLDFDIALNDANPRALQTFAAIQSGVKLGTSIGAIVRHAEKKKGGGYKIDDIELLEASIVGIPANPRSWVQYAVKAIGKTLAFEDFEIVDETGEPDLDPELKEAGVDETTPELPEGPVTAAAPAIVGEAGPETTTSIEPPVDESDPDKVAAKTRVTVTVDSDAQEAPKSQPEQAVAEEEQADLASDPATAELGDAVTRSVDSMEIESADVATLVKQITKQIQRYEDLRKQYDDLKTKSDEDAANLAVARQIIDRISDLPVGRKTVFQAAVSDYRARFPQYDEDFIKMLEK